MSDHEIVEMRHPSASSDDDRDESVSAINAGHRRTPASAAAR